MALKTFVKVSGINNLSDARYCAGMEVNELGFNIESNHENYTDPQKFKEVAEWLSGVEFIGEIVSNKTNISQLTSDYQLNGLQIAHSELIDESLKTGLKVSYIADSIDDAKAAWIKSEEKLDYILLSNSGLDHDSLKELSKSIPLVITDGFDQKNVESLLEQVQPKGIALTGGNEIRPGYKDFDELADILELLEIDDLA